jgi:hypothetical protein
MSKYCPFMEINRSLRDIGKSYHSYTKFCLEGDCALWREGATFDGQQVTPGGCGLAQPPIVAVQVSEDSK